MPQMSPMMWTTILLISYLMIMQMLYNLYFNIQFKKKNKIPKNKSMKIMIKW
uniref:ATP synthase F0 subunit 8 n=1 Tax=Youtuus strigatus TaxID=2820093 RepID=A0A8A4VLN5_9HEMI|nr:ATP synthase F0 subunit 8 [Youtuus strigatus]QTD82429.1 ATP synthase F0 subunit 8 [Youtuus strigatus]